MAAGLPLLAKFQSPSDHKSLKSVPQRLKPSRPAIYGTAEAVPFVESRFPHLSKSLTTRISVARLLDHSGPNWWRGAGYRSVASERFHKLADYVILLAT
jgi:hypothetical protein